MAGVGEFQGATCVVNLARGGWYRRGQKRLAATLRQTGFSGELLFFENEHEIGAPRHGEVNYAFKPFALEHARRLGYRYAVWSDASFWAVRPIDALLGCLASAGHLLFANGASVGVWSSDSVLRSFEISRTEALSIPEIMGGLVGLDFARPHANRFLDLWLKMAESGDGFNGSRTNQNREISSDPRVQGHRNDQTVASLLVQQERIAPLLSRDEFIVKARNRRRDAPLRNSVCLVLERNA